MLTWYCDDHLQYAAKSLQSCPTLCDPVDGSPPGSPIPVILQARTLEWVAISFSSAWKWKEKVKSLSHVRLFATPWAAAYQAPPSMGFSRKKYWSGVPLPSPSCCCRWHYFLIFVASSPLYICTTSFISTYLSMFSWFPCLGCCEQCFCGYCGACFFLNYCFVCLYSMYRISTYLFFPYFPPEFLATLTFPIYAFF